MGMRTLRTRLADGSFDLDLTAMMSMMMKLVPVLLLETSFVHIAMIETPIPQVVSEAIQKEKDQKDRKVAISLNASRKAGLEIVVANQGKSQKTEIPMVGSDFNVIRLHQELVRIKLVYPETFRLELNPTEDVNYKEVVTIIDAARKTQKEDPKLKLRDEKTGKDIEHDQLFPEVVFGNVTGA